MRIAGAVIAGGRSSRMGQEKAFAMLGGQPLLAHVIARIAAQTDALFINANGDPARFDGFGRAVIPDLNNGIATPLAGLQACLQFAAAGHFDAVVTVPSDAPFLPRDLVRRLADRSARAAIARSGGQDHFLTGLWSVGLRPELDRAIAQEGLVRVKDWTRRCQAVTVAWAVGPHDPFFNVNTPEDLAEARRIAAEFPA
jgi:molybdopterin-guanine dinucleotide biosynthesis protein A